MLSLCPLAIAAMMTQVTRYSKFFKARIHDATVVQIARCFTETYLNAGYGLDLKMRPAQLVVQYG